MFSIIVPAFEAAGRIEAVAASVLAQSITDLELIVVDDGSRDGTSEVVERLGSRDPRVHLIRQDNRGVVLARNTGIDASSGRYLCLLDDDDLWLPSYLERLERAFGSAPEAGLAYADAWVVDACGRVEPSSALDRFARRIRRLPAVASSAESLRALVLVNFITTCGACFSRDAWNAAGPLDVSVQGCDDWDLWIRMTAAGFGTVRVPERLVVRRLRADSLGSNAQAMATAAATVLQRFLRSGAGGGRTRRVAHLHRSLIEREVRTLGAGSPARYFWGPLRRVGRKRVRWSRPRCDLDSAPPAELRRALARLDRD